MTPREIFVFGSNLAGIHGAGSARTAYDYHGARYGVGVGPTGDAYAIPTKGFNLEVLPLDEVAKHVREFLAYADAHRDCVFHVVKVGCGLAGFSESEIEPLFAGASENVELPVGWRR